MKKAMILLVLFTMSFGYQIKSFASDWDVAGKVLTGIEGIRILTRGEVDILGTITGINNKKYTSNKDNYRNYRKYHAKQTRSWIQHFVWKKKWIPTQKGYNPKFGKVIIEGHYIRYKIEKGGHWEYSPKRDYNQGRYNHQ